MKKIILFLLLILFTNCGTYNKEKSKQNLSLENQLNSLDYNLALPETWHPYLDIHGQVSYKPINHSDKDAYVGIHLYKIPPNEHKNRSLNTIAEEKIKNRSGFIIMHSYKSNLVQSRFGETYVFDKFFNLNSNNYRTKEIYFKYKENYYNFSYFSDEAIHNKYLDDCIFIFEKLGFKEK